MKLKQSCYAMIYLTPTKSGASKVFWLITTALIIVNIIAVILETVSSIYQQYHRTFFWVEISSGIIFAFEYVLRLWVINLNSAYHGSIKGRLKWMTTPMAIIDIASILPSILLLSGIDLRVLRIFRLFRALKLTRYSKAIHIISEAIRTKKDELEFALIAMLSLLLVSSVLIYFAEHDAQPQGFSSIPASIWWCIVTLTTIGYGDIYPITLLGRFIAFISAIVGIGLFALPGGLIAAALIEQSQNKKVDK